MRPLRRTGYLPAPRLVSSLGNRRLLASRAQPELFESDAEREEGTAGESTGSKCRRGVRLEAAFEGQVGEERDFGEGGERVLEIEDSFGMEAAERA